jgi:hypothetical protein
MATQWPRVACLCATKVTEKNRMRFVDAYVPRVHGNGRQLTGRALSHAEQLTHAEQKRRDLICRCASAAQAANRAGGVEYRCSCE